MLIHFVAYKKTHIPTCYVPCTLDHCFFTLYLLLLFLLPHPIPAVFTLHPSPMLSWPQTPAVSVDPRPFHLALGVFRHLRWRRPLCSALPWPGRPRVT